MPSRSANSITGGNNLFFLNFKSHLGGKQSDKPISDLGSKDSPVEEIYTIPYPEVFFKRYVSQLKPVVFKKAIDLIGSEYSAYTLWTDSYLSHEYGNLLVEVESGKKEDRRNAMRYMTLEQFVDVYQGHDFYMVHNVPNEMASDVCVPWTLFCGGFNKVITEAVIWFSSGGTKSLLHHDNLDNINCLLSGHKDVILFDSIHNSAIMSHGYVTQGGYMSLDVDSVDLDMYPQFVSLPLKQVHLEAGDCLFIPAKMFHQVNTAKSRSIAINLWFAHIWWFNRSSCMSSPKHLKLSEIQMSSANEQLRSSLLEVFSNYSNITREAFKIGLNSHQTKQIFSRIDENQDEQLSWPELYTFDMDWLLRSYPELVETSNHPSHDDL